MPLRIQDSITASATGTLASARASTAGANLARDCDLHLISTCAAASSVALPVSDVKLTATFRKVRNGGVGRCFVFPDTGGAITCNGGVLAANEQYVLEPNQMIELFCVNGLDWVVSSEPSVKIESYTTLQADDTSAATIAASKRQILASESGKTFRLTKTDAALVAGAAYDNQILLPAPVRGLNYKFSLVSVIARNLSITATGAIITSRITELAEITATGADGAGIAAGTYVRCTAANGDTHIVFGATAAVEDSVSLVCDGTNWYADILSRVVGSITVA